TGARARGELAVGEAHPVQVTVEVAHHGEVAVDGGRTQVAAGQGRLLPVGRADVFVDGPDRARGIAHHHAVAGHADAAGPAAFRAPQRAPGGAFEGDSHVLVAAGDHDVAVDHRR